jgi:hypothetical protein
VPTFAVRAGNHKFRFAIDFGTTNTHIEYSVNDEASKAFDITEADMQIQKLHLTDDADLRGVFNSDFLPETIGGESIYRYPMRTVISESQSTNWSKAVYSMANTNIPFTYEKVMPLSYNILHTDLKWSAKQEDKQRAHKYIESLLVMLRNKVLLNNGDLSRTEIVWFYPASMSTHVRSMMEQAWNKAYKDYFDSNFTENVDKITSMSESIAPYYHYMNKGGAMGIVTTIDIGGGTTDVYISDGQRNSDCSNNKGFLISFRCASNAIFGDGYNNNINNNGFIRKYRPIFEKAL